jgi:hypothetical protein
LQNVAQIGVTLRETLLAKTSPTGLDERSGWFESTVDKGEAATNATIIRKAYGDFANGDIPAVLQAFDTSIIWHVPGHSPLSGDYKGPDEIVGFFKHTLALCGGTFAIEVHHVLAEEDVVVARDREGGTQPSPRRIPGGACMAARK